MEIKVNGSFVENLIDWTKPYAPKNEEKLEGRGPIEDEITIITKGTDKTLKHAFFVGGGDIACEMIYKDGRQLKFRGLIKSIAVGEPMYWDDKWLPQNDFAKYTIAVNGRPKWC